MNLIVPRSRPGSWIIRENQRILKQSSTERLHRNETSHGSVSPNRCVIPLTCLYVNSWPFLIPILGFKRMAEPLKISASESENPKTKEKPRGDSTDLSDFVSYVKNGVNEKEEPLH